MNVEIVCYFVSEIEVMLLVVHHYAAVVSVKYHQRSAYEDWFSAEVITNIFNLPL